MNQYLSILVIAFLAIAGCSDMDETPTPKTTSVDSTATHKKVSDDNPFKSQLDALDAAKKMGITAQDSIDSNQQKLEQTTDYSQP
ncbi:MAG: hypothetical protein OEY06_08835 [Gammaproteobacteria bacterium]|nr:hypothetical protein [Gammaproteobacteria bacterium]